MENKKIFGIEWDPKRPGFYHRLTFAVVPLSCCYGIAGLVHPQVASHTTPEAWCGRHPLRPCPHLMNPEHLFY
jgi:hypothetical protein